jgi:hypothetical protein
MTFVVQGRSGLGGPLALAQAVAHKGVAAKQIGVDITAQTGQPTPSLRRIDPELLPGGSRGQCGSDGCGARMYGRATSYFAERPCRSGSFRREMPVSHDAVALAQRHWTRVLG